MGVGQMIDVLALWIYEHPVLSGCISITTSVMIVIALNALFNYQLSKDSE
jgi:hypothetical protein